MDQERQSNKTQLLANQVAEYVSMRIDAFKLNLVENLSSLCSSALSLLIFGLFASMAMMMFTVAFTYWLGLIIGSMLLAVLVVGLGFLVIAFLLFALRHRLITDRMVRMFSNMFFNSHNSAHDDDSEKQ